MCKKVRDGVDRVGYAEEVVMVVVGWDGESNDRSMGGRGCGDSKETRREWGWIGGKVDSGP